MYYFFGFSACCVLYLLTCFVIVYIKDGGNGNDVFYEGSKWGRTNIMLIPFCIVSFIIGGGLYYVSFFH